MNPIPKDTTLKLSEAIRLGSMLSPQGYGWLYPTPKEENLACALGAAYEAIGLKERIISEGKLDLKWLPSRWVSFLYLTSIPDCPAAEHGTTCADKYIRFNRSSIRMADAIAHLNDDHCWTREQIADWVATQEVVWDVKQKEKQELQERQKQAAVHVPCTEPIAEQKNEEAYV